MTRDYDERGRIIKIEYFDAQGRPEQGPAGFAKSRVIAFDDFGGADMEFEDEQGRPVEPAILVTDVKDGGPGARAGLRRSDVILRYDGKRIHFGIFAAALRAPAGSAGAMRELVVLRGDALVTMRVEPGPLQLTIEPVRRPATEAGGGR
jgi:S1-C subfamily serine protease